jgi:hypothetical protein
MEEANASSGHLNFNRRGPEAAATKHVVISSLLFPFISCSLTPIIVDPSGTLVHRGFGFGSGSGSRFGFGLGSGSG